MAVLLVLLARFVVFNNAIDPINRTTHGKRDPLGWNSKHGNENSVRHAYATYTRQCDIIFVLTRTEINQPCSVDSHITVAPCAPNSACPSNHFSIYCSTSKTLFLFPLINCRLARITVEPFFPACTSPIVTPTDVPPNLIWFQSTCYGKP